MNSDLSYFPTENLINFKDYNLNDEVIYGKQFKLMWDKPESSCAAVEELFFDYVPRKFILYNPLQH